jgi:hypothetical protein
LTERDIPRVALLHRRVFGPGRVDVRDTTRQEAYLRRIFLGGAAGGSGIGSLVYEEEGQLVGFLGVVSRNMEWMGKPVVVALSSQFIVDRASRSGMVGLRLLKEYLAGPQDLSIADEANDTAKTLWESFGGKAAFFYSLSYTRPLHPSRYLLAHVRQRKGWRAIAFSADPIARLCDAVAARLPWTRLVPPRSDARGERARPESLWTDLPRFCAAHPLRPALQLSDWTWMLHRAAEKVGCGELRQTIVKSHRNETLGWYLYYLNPGGISEVVQFVATRAAGRAVWNHMLHDAWQGGAVALSGRLEPGWMAMLAESRCFFHRGPWTLVHAKKPELPHSFLEGTAFFSRLEGEWCLRYQ